MKVIILRFWQLKVLVFSSDKQLRAAFMAVTVVTVLFNLILPFLGTVTSMHLKLRDVSPHLKVLENSITF